MVHEELQVHLSPPLVTFFTLFGIVFTAFTGMCGSSGPCHSDGSARASGSCITDLARLRTATRNSCSITRGGARRVGCRRVVRRRREMRVGLSAPAHSGCCMQGMCEAGQWEWRWSEWPWVLQQRDVEFRECSDDTRYLGWAYAVRSSKAGAAGDADEAVDDLLGGLGEDDGGEERLAGGGAAAREEL